MSSPASVRSGRKVGLLFGSFNPIHTGHLILAHFMATHTDLEAVWLVVSPQSPFKVGQELLGEQERLDLVQARHCRQRPATGPGCGIQPAQAQLHHRHAGSTAGPTPRVPVRAPHGRRQPAGLPDWKAADRIITELEVYVYPRPGHELPEPLPPSVRVVEAPLLDISATFLRRCLHEGRSIRYLVPEAVEQQIQGQGYYQQLRRDRY